MRFLLTLSFLLFLSAFSSAQSVGKEMLTNPDFSSGLAGWKTSVAEEYRALKTKPPAVKSVPGGLAFCWVKVPHKAGPHYIQIQQPVDLVKGKTYRVKGETRLIGDGSVRIALWNTTIRRNAGFGANIKSGPAWQSFEYLSTPTNFNESAELVFAVGFAGSKGTPAVRNLSFTLTDEGPVKRTIVVKRGSDSDAETASITAAELLAEFKADPAAARAKYTKPIALNGPITNVSKGPTAGMYVFELEFGAVRVAGRGSELGGEALGALATELREGKARLASMQNSPKWGSFSADEKKGHARSCFPTLHATATFTGLKGKSIECGRSSDLMVAFE